MFLLMKEDRINSKVGYDVEIGNVRCRDAVIAQFQMSNGRNGGGKRFLY